MSIQPFKYLPNFKNPCFKRQRSKAISCFPYYFLVGAPKSGTTDLSKRISRHPDVSSNVLKESHWLTRKRFDRTLGSNKFYPTLTKEYASIFENATRAIIASGNKLSHTKVVGDCSASNLWDNRFWPLLKENKNRSEPLHTNADFIHHFNPRAKIIIILRNPIDRLYSEHLYFNEQIKSPEQFHTFVKEAIAYFTECFRHCSDRNCIYTQTKRKMRLQVGLYYYTVADYMNVFTRDQVLVIKMENYSANMTHFLRQVFAFLELDPLDEEHMAFVTDNEKVFNVNKNATANIGPMLPATRQLLYRFYKPYNAKLEKLLGTKLWEDEAAP